MIYKNVLDENGTPTIVEEEIARIQWHRMSSTQIVFNGQILEVDKFMPVSDGWGM